jgi:alkylation response protein AidB-like acyl-CoA dehydrogenase
MRAQELSDGEYLLEGHKVLVLGGSSADKFIVSARIAGRRSDASGISLFLVDRDARGLTRHDYRLVDGFRATDLTLSGVRVGPGALLGEPGQGTWALERAIDHTLVAMAAEACGAMDTLVWQTRDYLKTRSQYGATLNTYQALQHRMADMLIESELSRAMLLQGLAALNQADPVLRRKGVSATKVQVGRGGYFVGKNAIQLHGGLGVTEEFPVGHYFKRLVSIGYQLGDTNYHLQRFA